MPLNLTIFRKGLLLVVVPLLFQLALLLVVAVMQQQLAEADQLADATQEVLLQSETVLACLIDLQTGTRGYLLTENPVFTEPYDQALVEVPVALQSLRTLVRDNPEQAAKVEELATKVAVLVAWYAERLQEIQRGERDRVVARIKSLEGKTQMDAIRRDMAAFRQEQTRLRVARTEHHNQRQQALQQALGVAVGAAFLITLLLAFSFHCGISRRLALLVDNAARLAQGKALLPPIGGGDEISAVDRAFRDMVQGLQQYTDIVQSVPIGLLILHLDNPADACSLRFVGANPAAAESLGIAASELMGKTLRECFPAVTPELVSAYADVVRTGTTRELEDIYYGDERVAASHWAVKAFPLPEQCLGLAFENISARKQAEAALGRLNAELDQRVTERTAELERVNRDLAQKNQEIELFVYSVSHDLRSPLVNLQGFSKELSLLCQDLRTLLTENDVSPLVRERGVAVLDGGMAKAVHFILTAVMRLNSIIDALLRLSRAGRVTYQARPVDLKAVVGRIVEAMRVTIAERGATVQVEDLPAAWGDPMALEQIFANFIGNALNYLDPQRPGRIEVGHLAGEGTAQAESVQTFYVKDNGLGIAEAYLPKVFQAFQRLHPEVAPGEGMGLKIVQRIVERHEGKVWVESKVGQGSTFLVALPARPSNGVSKK